MAVRIVCWLLACKQALPLWDALGVIFSVFKDACRFDKCLLLLIAVFVVAFGPLIPRATDNAILLAALYNDEPPLTMALDAMTVRPYGNPANYYAQADGTQRPLPEHWRHLRYGGFTYYGGTYLGLGFVIFKPLKKLGAPTFPTAPIILRTISFLAGMLSLIFVYHFGMLYANKAAAIFGVVALMTDVYFANYTILIHPDTLQLGAVLLGLLIAIRHAEQGDLASLLALGIVAGLVQGTKLGGPWLVPMAVLSLVWGWKHAHEPSNWLCKTLAINGRFLLLGGAAGAAFFLSTPYAFLDSYYHHALQYAWNSVAGNPVIHVGFVAWLESIHRHQGTPLFAGMAASVAIAIGGALFGRCNKAHVLAVVLAVSNIVWYAYLGKLWVVPAYLLPAFSVLGVLGAYYLFQGCNFVSQEYSALRWLSVVVPLVCFAYLIEDRSYHFAKIVLETGTTHSNTCVAVNHWAEMNLPHDSDIVFDDAIYFDPEIFTRTRMWGGVLKYEHLNEISCEYIILNSTLYDAPWYRELRKQPNPDDTSAFSMRLYRDLLDRNPHPNRLGATGVPGVELVALIEPTMEPPRTKYKTKMYCCTDLPNDSPYFAKKTAELRYLGHLVRGASGAEEIRHGPTLRVYRLSRASFSVVGRPN